MTSKAPEILFDFPEAIGFVRDGKRITKLSWANRGHYGVLRDGLLMIHLEQWHTWTISDGDLVGTDWIVLD